MQRKPKYIYDNMEPVSEDSFHRQIIREELRRITLYEGLVFSYSPPLIFPRLQQMGYNNKVSYNYSRNIFTIGFDLDENNVERYEKLNNFMDNVCGWYHAETISAGQPTSDKVKFLTVLDDTAGLQYEAKFDIKVNKIPNKIYHLTSEKKLNKILDIGLTPKTSTEYFTFNDRIYFSLTADSLIPFTKKKWEITGAKSYVVLEIDSNYFPVGIRFFKDPNFDNGIYTLENIPPSSVEPIFKAAVSQSGEITKTMI
jgi:hypothetical protein